MKNIYYLIWVDGITRLKSLPQNKGTWKAYAIIFITMAMAMNIMTFMAILQRNIIHKHFYSFNLNLFPGTPFDALIEFFILFIAAPLVVNYYLIFKNKRYEKLMPKYKTYNGKLCATYMTISYFLPFALIFIGAILETIFKIKF